MAADFTPRQGLFLAFIYYYTKIHRIPPAETDMQRFFRISPPAVHEMVSNSRLVIFALKTRLF